MALAPRRQNFHQALKVWYRVDIKGSSELRPKLYNTLPVYTVCLSFPTPEPHICLHGWAVNVMESKWHPNYCQVSVTLSNAFSCVFRTHSSFDFFANECLSSHISHALSSSHFTDEDIEFRRMTSSPSSAGR